MSTIARHPTRSHPFRSATRVASLPPSSQRPLIPGERNRAARGKGRRERTREESAERREGEDERAGSGTKYEVDERHVLKHTGAVALPGTCFHVPGNGERPSEPASIRGDTGQGGLGPEKTRGQARRRPRGREDAFNTRVHACARPIPNRLASVSTSRLNGPGLAHLMTSDRTVVRVTCF